MSIADISLFNQDRLLLLCGVASIVMTLVFVRQTKRWYTFHFPYYVIGSILVGTILWTLLWHLYPEDGIPLTLIFWAALPLFSLSILFTVRRNHHGLLLASTGAFFSLLLSLFLANAYFQYFPTLGSIFGDTSTLQDASNGVITQSTGYSTIPKTSLEASYIPSSDQPTSGSLTSIYIPGPISHFSARQSFVYLPPAALTPNPPKLPVLILLSGVPGNPGDWKDRMGVSKILNDFAAEHKGITPIVVLADQTGGDGFTSTGCVNSSRGNAETYLTTDVPNYIKSHYNVLPDPAGWGIGGISDGGACSTIMAIRHPDIFSTFVSLSGETSPSIESKQDAISSLFNGSPQAFNAYDTLLVLQSKHASSLFAHTAGWLAVGRDEQEPLVQDNQTLFSEAKQDKIDMTLETLPGHHGFGLWQRAFMNALPWTSSHLGATL